MKSNRLSNNSNTTQFRRNAVAFGVALAIASSAYANPNGMSVVAGQATAQTIGNLMQITNSPGAILNWQQFNIDVGQTTQFIQQNAASQVFNRVTGGDVSQILGTLQSNGQVFLINPAGVFFGQGAVVDTAGFLASTLAASNTDLLNGHLKFSDPSGTAGGIVNQGSLTTHSGGSIVLLAPSIENSGIIHAQGEVLLAAGHSVTIVDMNHPTIGLTVAAKAGEKAVNLGQIISKNASLFSHLVNNSGVVEATGAQLGEGGVIRFIAQGDALIGGQVLAESTSGKGGEIDITGNRVAVLDGARISADGGTGGGTVHIGGGWQGQDATLANSQQTIVQGNTEISANAIDNGNGGEVVVWADGHTTVNSEIQAKGGALGGNGGRVETSGKESLAANVAANTSAANGEAGQWLLDPANLTIVSDADFQEPSPVTFVNQNNEVIFSTDNIDPSTSPTESFLRASTVVQGLHTNGTVVIRTTGQSAGEGNITVAAPILAGAGLTSSQFNLLNLDLIAQGEINIDAPVGLAPGQTVFNGFNLSLDYDLAKPVYIDALSDMDEPDITFYEVTDERNRPQKMKQMIAGFRSEPTIIFCNFREDVDGLLTYFEGQDFAVTPYHGGLEQDERERSLIKFRNGSTPVLICTDLGARGLDIPKIKHIIHYQLPEKEDAFIHRNGRTARMSEDGSVYLFEEDREGARYPLPECVGYKPKETAKYRSPEWTTIYFSAGKKDKINKIDLLGFICQKGGIGKQDVGMIAVLDRSSYVALRSHQLQELLPELRKHKVKGQKLRISVSR